MRAFQPEFLVSGGRVLAPGQWLLVDDGGRVAAIVETPPADAERIPLRGRLLLPGLVNGHSHAFQRVLRGRTEFLDPDHQADDFWSWRERMYLAAESLTPEEVFIASRQAFIEMALCGVTTVGEFHYLHHAPDGTPYEDPDTLAHEVIRAAREVGLRITLLRVAYARAGYNAAANPRQRRFIDPSPDRALASLSALRAQYGDAPDVKLGLAPHSVRAVPRPWLEAFRDSGELVHMHIAEQPKEIESCVEEHQRRPVEVLADIGLLGPKFTGVHGIHLAKNEIALLGESRSTVCACPSTERNLGDGIVPADALLAAGADLSLGSDSHAAINLIDEARQLEGHLRLLRLRRAVLDPANGRQEGLAERLLRCATRAGARSLGFEGGSLIEGEPADFFTVDLAHPSFAGLDASSLLGALFVASVHTHVVDVMVNGRLIVTEGQHPLGPTSGAAFNRLIQRLYA